MVFAIRQAIPIQEYTNKQEPCSSPTSHDPKCATLCQCAFRTRAYIIQYWIHAQRKRKNSCVHFFFFSFHIIFNIIFLVLIKLLVSFVFVIVIVIVCFSLFTRYCFSWHFSLCSLCVRHFLFRLLTGWLAVWLDRSIDRSMDGWMDGCLVDWMID